jgi:hypothetical protein
MISFMPLTDKTKYLYYIINITSLRVTNASQGRAYCTLKMFQVGMVNAQRSVRKARARVRATQTTTR